MQETNDRQIQLKAHQDALIFSEADFPALGGGWGNGKTLAGCAKGWQLSEESPNNMGVVVRQHLTDLVDTTYADFVGLFGGACRIKGGQRPEAILPNGSRVLFRHASNLHSLNNMNLGWFWIEQAEEVTEDVFLFLRGRLRREGVKRHQGFLTFNMEGHNWIWRTWLKLLDKDEQPLDPEDYHLIVADTLANKDNLPESFVRQILKLPEKVKARYVFSSWDVFEGQIYPMFSDQIHVVPLIKPEPGWQVFEMGDHGRKNPTVWLWGAVDFDGNLFIFDEHYLAGAEPSVHAEAMKRIRSRYGLEDVARTVIDPSIEETDLDLYWDRGIHAEKANNDVIGGINKVAEYLSVDPDRTNPFTGEKGSPRLFISRNCVNLIREMHEYQWKVLRNRSAALNEPEQPRKFNDHAPDALRYGVNEAPSTPEKPDDLPPNSLQARMRAHLKVIRAQREEEQDPMADYA
jgi:hypothetical protein